MEVQSGALQGKPGNHQKRGGPVMQKHRGSHQQHPQEMQAFQNAVVIRLIISSIMDKLAKSRVSANSNENYKVPNDDHAQNRKDFCCFSHCCFLTSHLRGQVLLTD